MVPGRLVQLFGGLPGSQRDRQRGDPRDPRLLPFDRRLVSDAWARLVAYLCWWYGIPIDRGYVIGHSEVSYTECPGPWWWWDYYMGLVWKYA